MLTKAVIIQVEGLVLMYVSNAITIRLLSGIANYGNLVVGENGMCGATFCNCEAPKGFV